MDTPNPLLLEILGICDYKYMQLRQQIIISELEQLAQNDREWLAEQLRHTEQLYTIEAAFMANDDEFISDLAEGGSLIDWCSNAKPDTLPQLLNTYYAYQRNVVFTNLPIPVQRLLNQRLMH